MNQPKMWKYKYEAKTDRKLSNHPWVVAKSAIPINDPAWESRAESVEA
jgi:hypothetical protein